MPKKNYSETKKDIKKISIIIKLLMTKGIFFIKEWLWRSSTRWSSETNSIDKLFILIQLTLINFEIESDYMKALYINIRIFIDF